MYLDMTDNTFGLADDNTISDVAIHMSQVVAGIADPKGQMFLRSWTRHESTQTVMVWGGSVDDSCNLREER